MQWTRIQGISSNTFNAEDMNVRVVGTFHRLADEDVWVSGHVLQKNRFPPPGTHFAFVRRIERVNSFATDDAKNILLTRVTLFYDCNFARIISASVATFFLYFICEK